MTTSRRLGFLMLMRMLASAVFFSGASSQGFAEGPTSVLGTARADNSIAVYPYPPNPLDDGDPTGQRVRVVAAVDCGRGGRSNERMRATSTVSPGAPFEILEVLRDCGNTYSGPYLRIRFGGVEGFIQPGYIPTRFDVSPVGPEGAFKLIGLREMSWWMHCEASYECGVEFSIEPYETFIRDYPNSNLIIEAAKIVAKGYWGIVQQIDDYGKNPSVGDLWFQENYRKGGQIWLEREKEKYRRLARKYEAAPPTRASRGEKAHIFYYPWYENLQANGRWGHWNQGNHRPPDDIASNFYPKLGPYSSLDRAVVDQHMAMIAQSGAGVVVVSWWGQGTYADHVSPVLLDKAAVHGLRIAFLIEPYGRRTPATIKDDIEYIYDQYGHHPAFFRRSRPTRFGPSRSPRGVFYVYNAMGFEDGRPTVSQSAWREMLDGIRGGPLDSLVLGQPADVTWIDSAHFDGLFTYDVYGLDGRSFQDLNRRVVERGGMFVPSVGPGYVDKRGAGTDRFKDRRMGATYDEMWQRAIESGAEWISITSFNEWHEGTQIEAAVPKTVGNVPYSSYEGHFGKTGTDAQAAYIERTAYQIGKWQSGKGEPKASTSTPPPAASAPGGEQVVSMVMTDTLAGGLIAYPIATYQNGSYRSSGSLAGVQELALYEENAPVGRFHVTGLEKSKFLGCFEPMVARGWADRLTGATSGDGLVGLSVPTAPVKTTGAETTSDAEVFVRVTAAQVLSGQIPDARRTDVRLAPGSVPRVETVRLLDLDGDGVMEVIGRASALVVGSQDVYGAGQPMSAEVLVLGSLPRGRDATLVRAWVSVHGEYPSNNVTRLIGVVDVDGDGTGELIISWTTGEVTNYAIYEYRQGMLREVVQGEGFGC